MIDFDDVRQFRAALLAQQKPVEVPEWGFVGEKALRVAKMRANAWLDLRERGKQGMPEEDDSPAARVFWCETIAASVVDAAGDYVFDCEAGRKFLLDPDLEFSALMRLVLPALEFNGQLAKTEPAKPAKADDAVA